MTKTTFFHVCAGLTLLLAPACTDDSGENPESTETTGDGDPGDGDGDPGDGDPTGDGDGDPGDGDPTGDGDGDPGDGDPGDGDGDPGDPPSLADPTADNFGLNHSEWNVEWWKWALDIPRAENPISDGDCAQGQINDDVWFLAGNSGGSSQRTCTIPEGKSLFFPLINGVCNSCPDVWGMGDCAIADMAGALACNDGLLDYEVHLTLTIDGVEFDGLDQHTADVAAFMFSYDKMELSWLGYVQDEIAPGQPMQDTECLAAWEDNNVCMMPAGDRWLSGGGWYVMVNPLSPGAHTLHFTGAVGPMDAPFFSLEVSYDLTVE